MVVAQLHLQDPDVGPKDNLGQEPGSCDAIHSEHPRLSSFDVAGKHVPDRRLDEQPMWFDPPAGGPAFSIDVLESEAETA